MRRITGRIVMIYFMGLFFLSCKTNSLFETRKYYGRGGAMWEFYSNNSYQYIEKMEGGYVYKFSKGTWKQIGNKLILSNMVSDPFELPIDITTNSSSQIGLQLVINILPKRNMHFPYLPSTTDLLNVELVNNDTIYSLDHETNIVRIPASTGSGYFRAYPKSGVEISCEILNDTLRSENIQFKGLEGKILAIDVDCNPDYLARAKMPDDTLQIINDHKIKWGKIYLKRPH
jgi:hypothetical protein